MKVFKKMTWCILFASCFVVFTACSDDDNDEPTTAPVSNLSNVFTGGLPKSVADMSMTYTDGLLTKIMTNDGEKIIFTYPNQAKSNTPLKSSSNENTTMSIYDEDGVLEYYFYNMKFGDNGFLKSCTQINYDDGEHTDTWNFEYNADKHLIYMKRSEGGNEVTTIKYENGDITEVSMESESKDEDYNKLNTQIFYISDKTKTAIENKGCLMFFDTTFGIDLDEGRYLYWAGFLGKATKHLPVKTIYTIDNETETFQWNLKNNGLPEKMIRTWSWDMETDTEEYLFSW